MREAELIARLSQAELTAREYRVVLTLARLAAEGRTSIKTEDLMAETGIRHRGDISAVTGRLRALGLVSGFVVCGAIQAVYSLVDSETAIIPDDSGAAIKDDSQTAIIPTVDSETTIIPEKVDSETAIIPEVDSETAVIQGSVDSGTAITAAPDDSETAIIPEMQPPVGVFPPNSPLSPLPPLAEKESTPPPPPQQPPSSPKAGRGGENTSTSSRGRASPQDGLFQRAREIVRPEVVNDTTLAKLLGDWVKRFKYASVESALEVVALKPHVTNWPGCMLGIMEKRQKEGNGFGNGGSDAKVQFGR